MEHKFKPGDKVRLISLEKAECEFRNWILHEDIPPKIGDEFEVERVTNDGYLILDKLNYDHPASKFEKVDTVGEEDKDLAEFAASDLTEKGKLIYEIYKILPCTCVDTYKSRQMADPNCPQCNYAEYIDEGIITPLLSTISALRAEINNLKKVK